MRQVAELPYEQNPFDLMRAADIARFIQLVYAWRSQSSYFCSELVACCYIKLGLLPDDDSPLTPTAGSSAVAPRIGAPYPAPATGLLPNFPQTTRHAGLYTPMDFAQESENLPFLYDRTSDESLVALGPHLEIVFPQDGADPLRNGPRRMSRPGRAPLRLDPSIEKPLSESELLRNQDEDLLASEAW